MWSNCLSACDTTQWKQFFLCMLLLDTWLCTLFFLHLLTGVWIGLSVIGAYLWVKVSSVIATPFQKIGFIRDNGKFLKSIQMRKCNVVLSKIKNKKKRQLKLFRNCKGLWILSSTENFCPNTFKLWTQKKIVCRCSEEISWFGSKFFYFSNPTEPPNSCVPDSLRITRKLKHFLTLYYFF